MLFVPLKSVNRVDHATWISSFWIYALRGANETHLDIKEIKTLFLADEGIQVWKIA